MKVFMDVTNTYDNRFYTNVMKAFLSILLVLWGKPLDNDTELSTHTEIMEFIKERHYKLLQETSTLANKIENTSWDNYDTIYRLKREYFHKFNSEKDLYKYCLKSREIRCFLQVVWGVFNYCEEVRSGSHTKRGHRTSDRTTAKKAPLNESNTSWRLNSECKKHKFVNESSRSAKKCST